jgi:hypothetical protein
MIKYLLIAGLVYVVYRYFNLADRIDAGRSKPKIEPKDRGKGDSDDFVEYEEIDD